THKRRSGSRVDDDSRLDQKVGALVQNLSLVHVQTADRVTESRLETQTLSANQLVDIGGRVAVAGQEGVLQVGALASAVSVNRRDSVRLDHVEAGRAADEAVTQTSGRAGRVSADEPVVTQKLRVELRRNNDPAATLRCLATNQSGPHLHQEVVSVGTSRNLDVAQVIPRAGGHLGNNVQVGRLSQSTRGVHDVRFDEARELLPTVNVINLDREVLLLRD